MEQDYAENKKKDGTEEAMGLKEGIYVIIGDKFAKIKTGYELLKTKLKPGEIDMPFLCEKESTYWG
ncbi:MAG: hypothetical protein WCI41_01055 [bacterium]